MKVHYYKEYPVDYFLANYVRASFDGRTTLCGLIKDEVTLLIEDVTCKRCIDIMKKQGIITTEEDLNHGKKE